MYCLYINHLCLTAMSICFLVVFYIDSEARSGDRLAQHPHGFSCTYIIWTNDRSCDALYLLLSLYALKLV